MATEAQIKANRANAQQSTGPQTQAGRARSSKNRLSHGFYSSCLFIPGENPEDFHNLLAALQAEFQPANPDEQILLEKMVQHQWLTLRAYRLQAQVLSAFIPLGTLPRELGVLIRYHHSSDRAYLRLRTELLKTQKQRKDSQIGFEPEEISAPAPEPPPEPAIPTPPVQPTPILRSIEDQIEDHLNAPLPMSDQEMLDFYRNWQKTGKSD